MYKNCYFPNNPIIVFGTRPMLRPIRKGILHIHHVNLVLYQFRCQCDAEYAGRMTQRLEAPINQHLPANIRKGKLDKLHSCVSATGSATSEHLIKSQL